VLLFCLAVTPGLLIGGLVFFAVRAAFWPSDSTRRGSSTNDAWPALRITARYDGANAQVVEETVALPLETQLAGLENVETIESVSREDSVTITLYFRVWTDLEKARTQVRERISWAERTLPDPVNCNGIRVTRSGPLPALWLILDTPDQSRDQVFLHNFAQTELLPEVLTIPGVTGATASAGAGPRLGLYLDADKLAAQSLTFADVAQALAQRDKGKPGEELMDVVVKSRPDGSLVRLGAVANLEICSSDSAEFARWNRGTAAAIAVETDSDAGAIFDAFRDKMPTFVARVPKGTGLHLLPGPAIVGTEALLIDARLPGAASDERVRHVAVNIAEAIGRQPDPKASPPVPAVLGLPVDEPTAFRLYVALGPRNERASSYEDISARARGILADHPHVSFRINPPWVLEVPPLLRAPVVVGLSGGDGDDALRLADAVRDRLSKCDIVSDVRDEYARPVPQLWVDVDKEKSRQHGIARADVMDTLQAILGQARVPNGRIHDMPVGLGRPDEFKDRLGRTWVIRTRADAANRPEDLKRIRVRDSRGEMVPLGEVVTIRNTTGLPYIRHVDGKRCMMLTAAPAAGVSQQEANTRGRQVARDVIDEMGLPKVCSVLQK
jgi:multidrug efflux pump subunit AcrB